MGRPKRRSAGFTLLELLIVLAVLVSLAALTWPAVRNMLQKRELQQAGKELRLAMARARLDAIETGVCRRFRYRPGTGVYEIASLRPDKDDTTSPSADQPVREGSASRLAGRDANEPKTLRLPYQAWFADPEQPEAPPTVNAKRLADAASAGDASQNSRDWSEPVLFFPNGRTTGSVLHLRGRRETLLRVELRALTGSVTLGNLQQLETETKP
jgi:prepilin-type N-terminal cleavage/methylation domain-containing protein